MRVAKQTSFVLFLLFKGTYARSWRDIETFHDPIPRNQISSLDFEKDPMAFTDVPTAAPTRPSTKPPTKEPSHRTFNPKTDSPTKSPTKAPTEERYPENPPPLNPPRGYFNYDPREENPYGPGYPALAYGDGGFAVTYQNNGWAWTQTPDEFYWDEFGPNGHGSWNGVLTSRYMEENQCGNTGMQSPIDIRLSGVACVEHHQIRVRVSEYIVA